MHCFIQGGLSLKLASSIIRPSVHSSIRPFVHPSTISHSFISYALFHPGWIISSVVAVVVIIIIVIVIVCFKKNSHSRIGRLSFFSGFRFPDSPMPSHTSLPMPQLNLQENPQVDLQEDEVVVDVPSLSAALSLPRLETSV